MNKSLQRNIHAVIEAHDGYFVASCLEVAVVTDGSTLDETVANLREAIELCLEGEDSAEFGLVPNPGVILTYEMGLVGAET